MWHLLYDGLWRCLPEQGKKVKEIAMDIAVISFTEKGYRLGERLKQGLESRNTGRVEAFSRCHAVKENRVTGSLKEWVRTRFEKEDAIVFIGAVQIAVRLTAPYLCSKTSDPAVLVIDEGGHYCIPVLSGHLGGGNELAYLLADITGAQPVVTTATDLRGKWAVDVFARKNHLMISDMKKAKAVSARILGGERLTVAVDDSVEICGEVPEELQFITVGEEGISHGPHIMIGVSYKKEWKDTLYLIPKATVIGAGCRKGISAAVLDERIQSVFQEHGIFTESVDTLASIDLKREETGLLELCQSHGWQFRTFGAEILRRAEGVFESSEFVRLVTGVDNVCERSAVCACQEGQLWIPKVSGDGVTLAAAVRKEAVYFEKSVCSGDRAGCL